MTRLQIEKEVLSQMGQVNEGGTIVASTNLRSLVQTAIQAAVESISQGHKFKYLRRSFGLLLKAPLDCSVSYTQGLFTVTVSGATPDSSWIGGSLYWEANGYPLLVIGVASQVLTLAQPILAPTASGTAAKMHFNGAMFPSDCSVVRRESMRLAGARYLNYLNPTEIQNRYGYLPYGSDYGFPLRGNISTTITAPDIAQPTAYTIWDEAVVSGEMRPLVFTYPFPDKAYSLIWEGWRRVSEIGMDGTGAGDTGVPDLPSDFHRTLLIPMVKLNFSTFPGFELDGAERKLLQMQIQDATDKLHQRQLSTVEDEHQGFTPSAAFLSTGGH